MFNQQHGQASFPHGDNDADTPHSTSSSERVQSPGTGLKSSPSFILQNLDVLTDMIAADVVESSLLHSAAKMVVDAQGLHPSSSNRAHDSSTGGLRRLLFDMSQLEESEKRLAQRWGTPLRVVICRACQLLRKIVCMLLFNDGPLGTRI